MLPTRPNPLGRAFLALKEWWPSVPARLKAWLQTVRAEPVLIWETRPVRYSAYGFLLLVGLLAVRWASGSLLPPDAGANLVSDQVDYHVICASPGCGHYFVLEAKRGFDHFPIVCPKCGHKTGVNGRKCFSPTCGGRWVMPGLLNGRLVCSVCRQPLE